MWKVTAGAIPARSLASSNGLQDGQDPIGDRLSGAMGVLIVGWCAGRRLRRRLFGANALGHDRGCGQRNIDQKGEAPTTRIDEPPAMDRSDRARGRSGRRPYADRAAFRLPRETLA